MSSRQARTLRVLSSIAVGIMAFCLTVPMAMLLGEMLLGPWLEGDGFFPPRLVILILIAAIAGIVVGIVAGIRYYRYLGKDRYL